MRHYPYPGGYPSGRPPRSSRRRGILSGAAATVTAAVLAYALTPSDAPHDPRVAVAATEATALPAPTARPPGSDLTSRPGRGGGAGRSGEGNDAAQDDHNNDHGGGHGAHGGKNNTGAGGEQAPSSSSDAPGPTSPGGNAESTPNPAPDADTPAGPRNAPAGTSGKGPRSGEGSSRDRDPSRGQSNSPKTPNASAADTQAVRQILSQVFAELARILAGDDAGSPPAAAARGKATSGSDNAGANIGGLDHEGARSTPPDDGESRGGFGGDRTSISDRGTPITARLTGFAAPDNNPPGSTTISQPVIHHRAGGVGTFDDPITAASPGARGHTEFPAGTKFYLPSVHRYVIIEDSGATRFAQPHLDVWNGTGPKAITDRCEAQMTDTSKIIKDPPPNLPVHPGPLADQTGCHF